MKSTSKFKEIKLSGRAQWVEFLAIVACVLMLLACFIKVVFI